MPSPVSLVDRVTEVLREHAPTTSSGMFNSNGGGHVRYCSCGERFDVLYSELPNYEHDTAPYLNAKLAAHQVAALSALIQEAQAEALRDAADELAKLQYVRPGDPGRDEYESMLAIRRGNTDGWLKRRADKLEGK